MPDACEQVTCFGDVKNASAVGAEGCVHTGTRSSNRQTKAIHAAF